MRHSHCQTVVIVYARLRVDPYSRDKKPCHPSGILNPQTSRAYDSRHERRARTLHRHVQCFASTIIMHFCTKPGGLAVEALDCGVNVPGVETLCGQCSLDRGRSSPVQAKRGLKAACGCKKLAANLVGWSTLIRALASLKLKARDRTCGSDVSQNTSNKLASESSICRDIGEFLHKRQSMQYS